jgi:nucleotide-binding universal stress UspA family protein
MTSKLNKPILFVSDLTPEMKTVFYYAATQALSQKTAIIILHVIEESSSAEGSIRLYFGKEKYKDLKIRQRKEAHKKLIDKDLEGHRIRQAIAEFFDEQEIDHKGSSLIKEIIVKEKISIVDEITSTAEKEDCGMIVMGCRKQGVISSTVGDNVVRKLLKKSEIPVLVVPFS